MAIIKKVRGGNSGTRGGNSGTRGGNSGTRSGRSGTTRNWGTTSSTTHCPHPSDGGSVLSGNLRGSNDVDIRGLLGSNSTDARFLGLLGNATGQNDEFLKMLLEVANGNTDVVGTTDNDLMQKLIEMYLSQMVKTEQRGYDEQALQEQRNFDSPTNQLARLMGAGISRDAALQMLQGTQDSPLVGSGADSGVQPFQQTPTQRVTQAVQTAAGFISTVGSLVSLGFTIPQAIQQTNYLKNANLLNERQIGAYDSAGQAYSILSAAGAAAESFDSVASASSAISKLADGGNDMATEFISSGGLAKMQSNAPFASNVLRDLYKSENGSEMFRKEMRAQDLANELSNAQIETEYQNILESLQSILESDERVKLYRAQVRTQKAIARQEEYAADYADFQGDVLERLRKQSSPDGDVVDLLSWTQFQDIWMNFREAASRVRDPNKFDKWCDDNWNAVCDLATIQYISNNVYRLNINNDDPNLFSSLLRFSRLMQDSGLGAQVSQAVKTAGQFLSPVLRK